MNLKHRSYQKELLDSDAIPFADIEQNMRELDVINALLGGHRITVKGFNLLRNGQQQLHVCEIGCGGGDNLQAIYKWCKKLNIQVAFTGIDIKEECIAYAKKNKTLPLCTEWICSDYRHVTFDAKPDIIFSSLFCHHFTNEELVQQLQWMQHQSAIGFFINDLQRHPLAYYSIKWLTQLFSKSYLVKNDAPLSVARGFIKKEWKKVFVQAHVPSYQIQWQWAFRYLITYRHE
ncbi:methyltransferase domain-containing protein [Ilyomonas limi]|uniref:Methyltransferase domain-containing protein n=1 Tax=Ilyomonas limi TaxID=2575867 RepID=A0A4U3L576_9BACT|nr:methyltransferase domain-containing protein [Ilyomonas limi]TKK70295.1 methyltransferase domain-containing protein [Ilyomonas limi]